MPLWYNSKISINFRKDWLNMGYYKLSDILDKDGKILCLEEMFQRGLKINFLEYEKLRYDISNINLIQQNNVKSGPHLPYFLFKTGHDGKGCSKTYNLLLSTDFSIILNIQGKWEKILGEEIKIETIVESFKNIHRMKEDSKYLQFRILHKRVFTNKKLFDTKYLKFRILHKRVFTNKKLFDMGIKENNLCPFCEDHIETFEHAFLQCTKVKKLE